MEIKIVKETRASGHVWYCTYLDGRHLGSHLTEQKAFEEIAKVKMGSGIEKEEIIYTETI